MFQVLLIIHLLIVLALIGVVLMQRSEGGGLGIGGGGGGGGGFMTGRGTANLLTRTTAILAGAFMATSLVLAILAGGGRQAPSSILDGPVLPSPSAPAQAPAGGGGGAPAGPAVPSVPVQ